MYKTEASIWYNTTRRLKQHIKVKVSRYISGVAQRVDTGIALLFHDRDTRRWVSGQQHAPAALYPPGKTQYPFYRKIYIHKSKGKVVPLQARCGPEVG